MKSLRTILSVSLAMTLLAWPTPRAQAQPLGAASPAIRVAVVQGQPEVRLSVHGRFRIRANRALEPVREGNRMETISVRPSKQGLLLGEELMPFDRVRIEADREAAINLNGHRVRGSLEIVRQRNDTLLVVNTINLEDYLRGVLSKEAPHYWPKETLRAIAIAARTYALYQLLAKPGEDYDVTAGVMSQVYGGRSAEKGRTSRAVQDTGGLILLYGGRVFPSFYHSTCGGVTENGAAMGTGHDIEPLRGGIRCEFCAASPFYRWQRRLSAADVAWAVKKSGRRSLWPVEGIRIVETSPTGRIERLRIRGGGRDLELSGYEFRQLFGFDALRSTAFTIQPEGEGFLLDGRGWGHGVGLCQWGASELGRRGLSAQEILSYYYPQATVFRLGDVPVQPIPIPNQTRRTP